MNHIPIYINISLLEMVDNHKQHTNEIMHKIQKYGMDERMIFVSLTITPYHTVRPKKMITKRQLLKELIWLKYKISVMPEKMAIDAIAVNI